MTISIAPFFQRPSRLLRASAETGANATARPISASKRRFIVRPYQCFAAKIVPSACLSMNAAGALTLRRQRLGGSGPDLRSAEQAERTPGQLELVRADQLQMGGDMDV